MICLTRVHHEVIISVDLPDSWYKSQSQHVLWCWFRGRYFYLARCNAESLVWFLRMKWSPVGSDFYVPWKRTRKAEIRWELKGLLNHSLLMWQTLSIFIAVWFIWEVNRRGTHCFGIVYVFVHRLWRAQQLAAAVYRSSWCFWTASLCVASHLVSIYNLLFG